MSFRYKSALLTLASLVLVYGWYFGRVIAIGWRDLDGRGLGGPIATVAILIGVLVMGHILIAIFSADRDRTLDERERGFDLRATNVGYYALVAGLFGLLPLLGPTRSIVALANSILAIVVVAECARQAVFVVQYHRAA